MNKYDEFAEDYMKIQNDFYTKFSDDSRKTFYALLDFPLKGKKVLDVGCGFGKDLSFFEKEGAIVYGIDTSEKMIELAKTKNPALKNLSVQSFEKTDFYDHFFDIIVSRYTLHYADNLEDTFKELNRILKHNGFLVFLVAHPLLGFVAKKRKFIVKKKLSKYHYTTANSLSKNQHIHFPNT